MNSVAEQSFPCERVQWNLTVGMPQLGFAGVSDAWLMQHLGHLHWSMIEEAIQQSSSEWSDHAGTRLYASFVATEVSGDLLGSIAEGDVLCGMSSLERLGTGLYHSEHVLRVADRQLTATAQLTTVFLRRTVADDNRSFARVTEGPTLSLGPVPTRREPRLLADYRTHKPVASTEPSRETKTFQVIPLEDFNGAGMVYFASFIRYVDRAEWLLGRARPASSWRLRRRRLFYYGNLNIGDSVSVHHVERTKGLTRSHLHRSDTGGPIAYCETERR